MPGRGGDWVASEHVVELLAPAIRLRGSPDWTCSGRWSPDIHVKADANALAPAAEPILSPAVADALYGPVLRTSVSALEHFAACPFRFFVRSGLRATERRQFEVDAREQGSFQHEILARFHEEIRAEGGNGGRLLRRGAATHRRIAEEVTRGFREGLFAASSEREAEADG
jgi:ATP-dependent helicase/DNAse subunit B